MIAGAIFIAFLVVYVATLTPGLTHPAGDSHELTVVAATLGLAHPTGYPLYTWVAYAFTRLIPIGGVAYRTNCLSAVGAAAAVALTYLLGRRLGLARGAAGFAAILFGTSTTLWSQAVITEVYAANAAMMALVLWLLLGWGVLVHTDAARADRRLVGCALALGLSLGTHFSNAAFALGFVVFVLATDPFVLRRPATIAGSIGAFALGVAQFVWLPLRAHVEDVWPAEPPETFADVLQYTIGVGAELKKISFSVAAVPDRIAWYGGLLSENFSWPFLALAVVGMWSLVARNQRVFWLLVLMATVQVVFLLQIWVPDPDPYFIPTNLMVALLVGVGIDAVGRALARWAERRMPGGIAAWIPALVVGVLSLVLLPRAVASWQANDSHTDTVVGDFYHAVFAFMPKGSSLVGRRGKFGSDIRYYRGLRPDVTVPQPGDKKLSWAAPVFTATEPRPVGATIPIPHDAWFIPALRGARQDATLYLVTRSPPALLTWDATPAVRVDRYLGKVALVGFDVPLARSNTIRLKTYWNIDVDMRAVVATQLDDEMIEAHELGFANLGRYRKEHGFIAGGIVVESIDVVVPSRVARGPHVVRVGAIDFTGGTPVPQWFELGTVKIP